MSSNPWDSLFGAFSQRRRHAHDSAERSRELSAWYDEQTQRVMSLIREVVQERAHALKQVSGVDVELRCPSHPPINVDPDGPFMSFMSLNADGREVHLYSHRVGYDAPMIHYVVTAAGEKSHGLLSRPGCRIERRDNGGFLLRGLGAQAKNKPLSVDDIAFRAFELLLNDG